MPPESRLPSHLVVPFLSSTSARRSRMGPATRTPAVRARCALARTTVSRMTATEAAAVATTGPSPAVLLRARILGARRARQVHGPGTGSVETVVVPMEPGQLVAAAVRRKRASAATRSLRSGRSSRDAAMTAGPADRVLAELGGCGFDASDRASLWLATLCFNWPSAGGQWLRAVDEPRVHPSVGRP